MKRGFSSNITLAKNIEVALSNYSSEYYSINEDLVMLCL